MASDRLVRRKRALPCRGRDERFSYTLKRNLPQFAFFPPGEFPLDGGADQVDPLLAPAQRFVDPRDRAPIETDHCRHAVFRWSSHALSITFRYRKVHRRPSNFKSVIEYITVIAYGKPMLTDAAKPVLRVAAERMCNRDSV